MEQDQGVTGGGASQGKLAASWVAPVVDAKPGEAVANPKQAVGSSKLPLHLWPASASAYGCLGMLDGALKYGRNNFRATGEIVASIYADAAKRHIDAWMEGEDVDPDSGLHPLCHALATMAIVVEAMTKGNLVDDRNFPTEYREMMKALTPHVKRLKELHAGKDPKHYTLTDFSE